MFGRRFFGAAYFGPRYWGDGGTGAPPAPEAQTSGGSWGYHSPRRRTDDEIREERERLGILPKEQKKLDRAARSIARRVEHGADVAAEVARAKEFNKVIADITARNRAVMEGFAMMVAQAIEARVLDELRDEDDAIAMLLLEM